MAYDVAADYKSFFPNSSPKAGDVFSTPENGAFEYKGAEQGWQPSESGGVGGGGATSGQSKIDTPAQWDGPKDARKLPGAGKYPNYWAHKTRSGHTFMLDDSKGAESVTLQHRGGSMIQMLPDGKVQIRSQNGRYDVTFGENRMYVTGAQDITVDGAASLTCKKDYNVTAKNFNITTEEDVNFVCRNFNVNASKKFDAQANDMTVKTKASIGFLASGAMGLFSAGGFSCGSSGDSAIFVGQKDLGIGANDGRLMLKSAAKMSFLSKSALSLRADGGKLSMSSAEDTAIDSDAEIKIQVGASEPPEDAKTIVVSKPA
jgi:hypothetical protein